MSSSDSARAFCCRTSSCPGTMPIRRMHRRRRLKDPARFVGATLADPLEGPDYGRCKAMVMRRADGTPWINSFAHGRTVYKLTL